MVSRKRWIAVLATVAIGALAYTATGVFTPAAQAQATSEASKDAPAAAPAGGNEQQVDENHVAVDNPYGISAMLKAGDKVNYGVLFILLVMSLGTWYIAIVKIFEQRKILGEADKAKDFWTASSVKAGIDTLKDDSAFRYIAEQGSESVAKHSGAVSERIDLNSYVALSIGRAQDNVQSRLQDGLSFLATVGSTAPFVGLFGTVWGIYNALTSIAIAGQPSIDKVAGPVGEALIMTAIGLAAAVPAVLFYNWLVRRNKVAMEAVRGFGSDLHLLLLGGKR